MIRLKNKEQIEILKKGGKILAQSFDLLKKSIKPGIKVSELNKIAHDFLVDSGGVPSFLNYGAKKNLSGFPSAVCISINDEVVHGSGLRDLVIKEGDIVGLDLGVKYPAKDGLFTDAAITIGVGSIGKEAKKLLDVTKDCLDLAIEIVKPGNFVTDISKFIQEYAESFGYSVVRDLAGHGVGFAVHEEPSIPCYYNARMPKIALKPGMVICIEPMITIGRSEVAVDDDGWTVRTVDGSLAAHFEHTIAVTEDGYEIITSL